MNWTEQAAALAADVLELGADAAMVNAAAWLARVTPDATSGLVGAALALGALPQAVMKSSARPLPHDREMLARTADLEGCAAELLQRALDLRAKASGALDAAAEAAAAAAAALGEDGPEAPARAGLAAAEAVIADAEQAVDVCNDLAARLAYALACLAKVPDDLATAYETPYAHISAGGTLPYDGDFLTGARA